MGSTTLQHIKKDKIKHKKLLDKYRYKEKGIDCNLIESENNIGGIFCNSENHEIRANRNAYRDNEKLWNV